MTGLSCFQWFKDTNLKANHNYVCYNVNRSRVVSNGSKILIWKQITTVVVRKTLIFCCFQWFKDTNLKANHNAGTHDVLAISVVSNGSKILIWKQITTITIMYSFSSCCFQWFKDTNLKANHNACFFGFFLRPVVSNGSKILIWKQITTSLNRLHCLLRLFPMVQRY